MSEDIDAVNNSPKVNFEKLCAEAPAISFNPGWNNGTGYLDKAAEGECAPYVVHGATAFCKTNNGRRILFVGTSLPNGNLVIYDRYTPQGNNPHNRLVCNMPLALMQAMPEAMTVLIDKRVLDEDIPAMVKFIAETSLA